MAAPLPKVDVCHLKGNGSYVKVNVSQNALSAHLAHGDALPLGVVPGSNTLTVSDFFTSTGGGGFVDLEIIYASATFTEDCSPDGPETGTISFDRSFGGGNHWTGLVTNVVCAGDSCDYDVEIRAEPIDVLPTVLIGCTFGGSVESIGTPSYTFGGLTNNPPCTISGQAQGNHEAVDPDGAGPEVAGTVTIDFP